MKARGKIECTQVATLEAYIYAETVRSEIPQQEKALSNVSK